MLCTRYQRVSPCRGVLRDLKHDGRTYIYTLHSAIISTNHLLTINLIISVRENYYVIILVSFLSLLAVTAV